MWLYLIAGAVAMLAFIGGVAFGGIFTLILLPLALIALVSAIGYALLARSAQVSAGVGDGGPTVDERPLPWSQTRDSGHVPTDPEALVDARREQIARSVEQQQLIIPVPVISYRGTLSPSCHDTFPAGYFHRFPGPLDRLDRHLRTFFFSRLFV